jgi:hypothetical protein
MRREIKIFLFFFKFDAVNAVNCFEFFEFFFNSCFHYLNRKNVFEIFLIHYFFQISVEYFNVF